MICETALIADDDEFFRVALRVILTTKLKFTEVIETSSFDDAVETLSRSNGISIALFDLEMPGMKSPANLRIVRQSFQSLRVAVVSSSARRCDILMALEAGAHGYVPKSLGMSELPRALQQIVDGAIYIPPSIAELPSCQDHLNEFQPQASYTETAAGENLTPRQREVLELVVQGKSNKEIGRILGLSEGTVKIHMAAIFRVLGVSCRAAAAVAGTQLLRSAR